MVNLETYSDSYDDEDNVSSGISREIYKKLPPYQQNLYNQLLSSILSQAPNSPPESANNLERALAELPRAAVEVALLDGLAISENNGLVEKLFGGLDGVITTPEGRSLALEHIVFMYLQVADFVEKNQFKRMAQLSDQEVRQAVAKSFVAQYSYGDSQREELTELLHYENKALTELGLTEQELSAEASQQAEAALADGNIEQALELASSIKLDDAVLQKIMPLAGELKDIQFVRFLGSRLETDMPEVYAHFLNSIVEKLDKDVDLGEYLVENIHYIKDAPWLKDALLKAATFKSVAHKLNFQIYYFAWSPPWVEEIKQKTGYAAFEEDEETGNHHIVGGEETFSDLDPHQSHPNKYTAEQKRVANVIFQSLQGKQIRDTGSEPLRAIEATLQNGLEVKALIDDTVRQMSEVFGGKAKNVSDIDRMFLDHDEYNGIRLQSFKTSIMKMTSRYLAQTAHDASEWSRLLTDERKEEIRQLLIDGAMKWKDAYEIEIPLYDKLYEHFDKTRQDGDDITEIYLGRDGIYAYLGRRAQAAARNSAKSPEAVKLHYLVYPRHFRDYLNEETKREYIEHEGLAERSNPHFYDTGYTGTIPEDIMRIMGMPEEEIERRIHLLSASKPNRRLPGIPDATRHDVVAKIEYNAKLEDSASGLTKDLKTGKIERIAAPTTSREQFLYLFLRQAFVRHYYLKEKLAQAKRQKTPELQAA